MADINVNKTIVQLYQPTIVLDELSIPDMTQGDNPSVVSKGNNNDKKRYGYEKPYIRINSFVIESILYFKLDLTKMLPTVLLKFSTADEEFLYTSYPKDGDILSLYIRSVPEDYKPIRMDFIIKSVSAPSTAQAKEMSKGDASSGAYQIFLVKGEIRLPKLYQEFCKSYPSSTSLDVLSQVSQDLQLGFASNISKTNDNMTWISPNYDYYSFLQYLSNHSYNSDTDFFDIWIDQYYNLNFVNMNKQFYAPDSIDVISMQFGTDQHLGLGVNSTVKDSSMEFPLALTNDVRYSPYPIFINSYGLDYAAGTINNNYGYFQELQFFDDQLITALPEDKYVKYNIESTTTDSAGDRMYVYKGRMSENYYEELTKTTWVGTQYFENHHDNFQQALVQNFLNKGDTYKTVLKTEMKSHLPFIYRGQNIFVRIIHPSPQRASGLSGSDLEGNSKVHKDPGKPIENAFLSGNYVVLGSYIEYSPSSVIRQTFYLTKRTWAMNAGIGAEPEPAVRNNT